MDTRKTPSPPSGLDLQTLDLATREQTRYLDLALVLRRRTTKEWLLKAGGRWDRLLRCYTDAPPRQIHFVDLEESQVEFTRWFATWLHAFKHQQPRDTSLAIAGGDRRGGKTFDLLLCTLATCLEVPAVGDHASPLIGWVVSCNYQERDEIDGTIREWVPSTWYQYRRAPEFRYTFVNGAVLRNVSADDPETLKRGRVDIAFYNEAQKQPVAALSNGIYGTVDKGGIALLAANPPRKQLGEWVLTLKEAIDARQIDGARFFGFSSKNNTQVQQDARSRVGQLLRFIDPRAAMADDEGAWLPVGERAYPKFSRQHNVAPLPQLGDVTSDVMKRRVGRGYTFAAGVDFQGTPHQVAVFAAIIKGDNGPIYWFCDEVIAEQATEDDLLDDIQERGYERGDAFFVGDASGAWQDGKHQFRGRVSFDYFKSRGYHIEPPQRPRAQSQTGRSRNPAIEDRLSLMFKLHEQRRIMVDPERCPHLAEAFKECPLKSINGKRKPIGRWSHATDAAGYLCWFLEPRPAPTRRAGQDIGVFSIPIQRRGSDVI